MSVMSWWRRLLGSKTGILVEILFGLLRHFRRGRTPDDAAGCRNECSYGGCLSRITKDSRKCSIHGSS